MGKIFIPMYSTPYHCHRKQPRRARYGPSFSPSLLDVLLNGVLGHLQIDPAHSARLKQREQPWLHTVNVKGFDPENISVKVEDRTVHITARQIDESESGHDLIERYRKVLLPDDVDADQLACLFDENGKLILKAPYVHEHHGASDNTIVHKTPRREPEIETVGVKDSPIERAVTNQAVPEPEVVSVQIIHEGTGEASEHVDIRTSDLGDADIEKENVGDRKCLETDSTPLVTVVNVPIVHEGLIEPTNGILDKSTSDLGQETSSLNSPEMAYEQSDRSNSEDNYVENVENNPDKKKFVISPPESPTDSVEFVIVQENDVMSENTDVEKEGREQNEQEESEENVLKIESDVENMDSLPQLDSNSQSTMDLFRVIDIEGEKCFEILVHLPDFTSENTTIRWKDDTIHIDAERELEPDTSVTVHREFTVPDKFDMTLAKTSMKDGSLRVVVPLKREAKTEL